MAWRLSAFGDEISDDLLEQLDTLRGLGIGYLELRGAWGKNVLHLSDDEVAAIGEACAERGISVSAIGSPVGKSPITQPLAQEMANLERIFAIAGALGTTLVRVFSFYPPTAPETEWTEDALVEEAVARLRAMTDAAERAGIQLVLENEHGIVGDTVARCQRLLEGVASPHLAFAWDPANFVHVGETTSVDAGWPVLGPRTRHVHIKDYSLAHQKVLPAGEGDGQIEQLLGNLARAGYDGFLALEPHLSYAGRSTGFSGPEGMERAVAALRSLLQRASIVETKPTWQSGVRR